MENKKNSTDSLEAGKKVMKKNIKNAFLANISIFIILVLVFLIWIYPNFLEVEAKKEKLQKNFNTYNLLKKSGISFGEFKKIVQQKIKEVEKSKSKKEKLEKILFLKKYLDDLKKENKNTDFLSFLDKKKVEVEKIENSTNMIDLERDIENILPSYVENDENISSLSDLTFINYLEKLIYAFGLKNTQELGIGNIVALDDDLKNVKKLTLSNNQIFYIPVKLELSGKKINILKFLDFLENVGKINISEVKENKKDNKKKKSLKKVLKINIYNDDKFKEQKEIMKQKNIYSNLLSTISNIRFNQYFDSKIAKNKTINNKQDLLNYIKETQGDEKYKVSLELRFYVKGLAKYKLKDYIVSLIKEYKIILKEVNNYSKKSQKQIFSGKDPLLISRLETLNKYLNKNKKEIDRISKGLSKQKNLVGTYNKLKQIEKKLKQAKQIIENLKK